MWYRHAGSCGGYCWPSHNFPPYYQPYAKVYNSGLGRSWSEIKVEYYIISSTHRGSRPVHSSALQYSHIWGISYYNRRNVLVIYGRRKCYMSTLHYLNIPDIMATLWTPYCWSSLLESPWTTIFLVNSPTSPRRSMVRPSIVTISALWVNCSGAVK